MSTNSEYRVVWLGYNEKPNYNRIWGWLEMNDGRKYCFFGVKNKKILFKKQTEAFILNYLVNQMENKGYEKIKVEHYVEICPNFIEELETWFLNAILVDDF